MKYYLHISEGLSNNGTSEPLSQNIFTAPFYQVCLNCSAPLSKRQPKLPVSVAQSVTCLATDTCMNADPGVTSSIPARSHTFMEIDHETISTVILLPSAGPFKKGCCQLQAQVCAQITG